MERKGLKRLWASAVERAVVLTEATGKIERRVLRRSMLGFRTVLGLPTYNPAERPTGLPARVRREDEWHELDFPIGQYTGAAAFPVFSLPSAWTGLSGNELVTDRLITVLASSGTTAMTGSLAARAGGEGYQIPVFGSPTATLWEEPPDRGHRVRVGAHRHGGVIAGVHLFADSGSPEYFVVVGKLRRT